MLPKTNTNCKSRWSARGHPLNCFIALFCRRVAAAVEADYQNSYSTEMGGLLHVETANGVRRLSAS